MKKNVLFVINSLGKGGAERVVANLINKLSEDNNVVLVIFNDEIAFNVNENIEIIKVNNKSKNKYFNIFKNVKALNKIILTKEEKGIKFDIITSHLPYSDLIAKMSLCKKEVIHVIHGPFSLYEKKFTILLKIILKLIYDSTNIITVSHGVQDELIKKYKIKPKKIKTIYNPIDIKKINKYKKENVEINDKYFLFCGRLEYIKAPLKALEIFYKGKFYEEYKMVYIGDGILKEPIIKLAREYNILDKVVMLGWQSNVYKWMNKAELLINTSELEAFSMVIVEALASNCKVLSFDCNYGPREIMKGSLKHYLVNDKDTDDYIEKIKCSLKEYPNQFEDKITQFNIDYIAQEYLDFHIDS